MNTVLDALAAGLPMAVLPLAFEQSAIAARVEGSGAGLVLGRRASAKRIAQALADLRSDPSFRTRAQALRREIESAGRVRRAADLIEARLI